VPTSDGVREWLLGCFEAIIKDSSEDRWPKAYR
jgi:hypothetical protein